MSSCRLLLLALFAACSGDSPPTQIDAPENLPACTNATFDPCTPTRRHVQRLSPFNGESRTATAHRSTTRRPVDANGTNGTCNMRGSVSHPPERLRTLEGSITVWFRFAIARF
jgi:hypothetical protein